MTWLKDALFPEDQRCLCCLAPLKGRELALCDACWERLCHLAFTPEERYQGRCPDELWMTASAFPYKGEARRLEQMLKFNHAPLAAEPLCHIMSYEAALYAPELLVPVPLNAARLQQRGYNQACELARRIAAITGLPQDADALVRVRDTPSQVGLDAAARRENVQGAFLAQGEKVKGKRILLVDDVMTTGSTAAACSGALKLAGAREVSLVTACRA